MEIIYYDNQYLESLNELLYESFKVTKTGNKASSDIELIAVIAVSYTHLTLPTNSRV